MKLVPTPLNGSRRLMAVACIVILPALITVSCKKKEKDFTEKFQTKWSIVLSVDSLYSSTSLAPMVTPYIGQPGEYMEFLPEGRMCTYIKKTYDTVPYTFSEQNFKINVHGRKYNIVELTDNSMILHEPKYFASATSNDYSAYKITLKR